MNLVIRQAINKHAHQQGIQHATGLKQRLMAYAQELLEEGATNAQVLAKLGIREDEQHEATLADSGWSRCVIE